MQLNQRDFFYPEAPGYKRSGTSQAAAEKMAPAARSLQDQVLALLQSAALTADECAWKLDKDVLSIRPRLSELATLKKIIDTGKTRKNVRSGLQATIWTAAPTFYAEHGG